MKNSVQTYNKQYMTVIPEKGNIQGEHFNCSSSLPGENVNVAGGGTQTHLSSLTKMKR